MRWMTPVASMVCCAGLLAPGACSTAPKGEDKADVLARAQSSRAQFERSVTGLHEQIQRSAGYVVFPDVAQFGIIFAGATWGRGVVYKPDNTQLGWAALNNGSVGLEAGVQGFRMLMVLEDQATLNKFMSNQLSGNAEGVAVANEAGGSASHAFQHGVVVYEGANRGLMAGANIGLNYVRFKSMEAESSGK